MRTIIKNGQIVTDSEVFKGDILIEDEKSIEVGESIECDDAAVIDAEGM